MEDKKAWHSATEVTCQTYRLCAPFSKASLQSQSQAVVLHNPRLPRLVGPAWGFSDVCYLSFGETNKNRKHTHTQVKLFTVRDAAGMSFTEDLCHCGNTERYLWGISRCHFSTVQNLIRHFLSANLQTPRALNSSDTVTRSTKWLVSFHSRKSVKITPKTGLHIYRADVKVKSSRKYTEVQVVAPAIIQNSAGSRQNQMQFYLQFLALERLCPPRRVYDVFEYRKMSNTHAPYHM